MKNSLFTLFLLIEMTGICSAENLSLFDTANLHQINFFEGSVRRDMKANEFSTFLKVIYDEDPQDDNFSVCGGFRVQQNNDRFFVASARHCVDFAEVEACEKKQIKIAPSDSLGGYFFGTCKKIIASSDEDDLFVMEVQLASSTGQSSTFFESKVKETFPAYNLAAYLPEVGTPLIVSGFPVDPSRQGHPTISEKCEVLSEKAQDSIYAMPIAERERLLKIFEEGRNQLSEYVRDALAKLNLTRIKHNCSVYGGNSGGPARIEGTKDIVGLPHDSWVDLLKLVPRHFARNLEATATFVRRHRETLEKEGVAISETAPKVRLKSIPPERKKLQTI